MFGEKKKKLTQVNREKNGGTWQQQCVPYMGWIHKRVVETEMKKESIYKSSAQKIIHISYSGVNARERNDRDDAFFYFARFYFLWCLQANTRNAKAHAKNFIQKEIYGRCIS